MPEGANENDDGGSHLGAALPDAHGQAALMLSESILHCLVEKAMISSPEALDIVQSAQEAKLEIAKLEGEAKSRMFESLHLLDRIAISLGTDVQ